MSVQNPAPAQNQAQTLPETGLANQLTFYQLLLLAAIALNIGVDGFWYPAGQTQVAHAFWEALRWHGNVYGTTVAMSLDPRDPLHTMIQLKPWHQPRIEVAVAVDGPTLCDHNRLMYGLGRV